MNTLQHYMLLAFTLIIGLSSCNTDREEVYSIREKVRAGDSMQWKDPAFDDSEWVSDVELKPKDVFWIRHKVTIPPNFYDRNVGMMIGATGSYEAYWDGVYVGTNGRLATALEDEKYGTYHHFFQIPDSLIGVGVHTVALRATKQLEDIGQHSFLVVDNNFTLLRGPLQMSKWMFLIGGIFLVGFVYFMLLFIIQPKDFSTLIFSTICVLVLGLLLTEYLKLFYLYEYPFQRTRLEIIGYLHLALTLLVPTFFMIQLDFKWKKYMLGVIILVALILEYHYHNYFDRIAIMHNQTMWILSTIIVAYACYQRKREAYIVMAGFALSFVVIQLKPFFYVEYVSNYDVSLFLSFMILLFTMLFVMTYRRKQQQLAYEQSLVLSERLKNDLLKKNIKPHFIMNTLTSMIDWVEESPKDGVQFIHALADEFEVLNEIADYKQVPIRQEIKLCESHLKVMGYRKEIEYIWTDIGIDPNEIIPPAVLHTIVENGVTHSLPDARGKIRFELRFIKEDPWKIYTLETFAQNRNVHIDPTHLKEGTGIKYIKARLQESYPNSWSYESKSSNNGWISIIKFK